MNDPEGKPKVVYDCNIFLQGLIRESGPAVACLELFERDEIELFISRAMLTELRDVLTRPKLQTRYSLLTAERAGILLDSLQQRATLIHPVTTNFHFSRDPKDEPYLNLALTAGVDFLVSRDHDLLDLMSGITVECKEFRQRFRKGRILDPVEFLKEVQKLQRQQP
ncbi:MAG: putative toxin-antitoxin system toxin component, PIN family [Blastocatellia bacterium]